MFRFGLTSCFLLLMFTRVSLGKEEIPQNVIAGKQVEPDANLKVGTRLVGIYDKKNYIVEVTEIKRNKEVRIHWVGFDKSEDADVPRTTLYYVADTSQTRKSRSSVLPKEFQTLDKNGDGQIGLYEWDRAKFAEFRKLDKNNDHFLTPQELAINSPTAAVAATSGSDGAKTATETKESTEVSEDPGNLEQYIGMIGETVKFSLTGKTDGQIVGTGTYTTSSDLATAAVHAGILKAGAKGVVTVTIIESPESFQGSMANGITSNDGEMYTAAYIIK